MAKARRMTFAIPLAATMALRCILALGAVVAIVAPSNLSAQAPSDWPMFGQNVANTASNTAETGISLATAPKLKMVWSFTTGGDVSARAAVVNGIAYFPDWAGNLWTVNTASGTVVWSHQLADYGLATGTVSRTTPAVANGLVYIGTQYNAASAQTGWLLAIDATTGALTWKIQPDTSNPFPVITASPVVAGGVVYVGMTSNEEFAAADPAYPCCSARGSIVALGASTGAVLWQTFTVPPGYSGGNVWGSNPVVDSARGTVFVGTGNNYSIPTDPSYAACIGGGGTRAACQSPADYADSILALNMYTGAIKWATRLETWGQGQYGVTDGSDFWNTACGGFFGSPVNCPPAPGPDYDFGSAPNEITYQSGATTKTIIGAGQKSGIYCALDPDTGAELWHTQVGPGSSLGGMEWGSASDGARIYVAIGNLYGIPYAAGSAGSWSALDPATGAIVWQKADPNGAVDLGPISVANGVVFAPSMADASIFNPGAPSSQTMFALDATTGNTLWSFAAGSSVIAGATVVDGAVYWGAGYTHLGIPGFTGNNKFYSFAVDASALNGQNCSGTYTGTFKGNLTVTAGQSCTLTNAAVTGNITQSGGTLVLANSTVVTGNLQITGGGSFSIGPSVSIGGSLQIQNIPAGAGTNQVCGASIKGNFTFHNNGTGVLIGSSAGCAGNKVGGDLQLGNNTAPTTIDNNTVGGNLTDQSNTAPTQVLKNVVTNNLQCGGNTSITGGGNTAASKQGQCAAF